MVVDGQARAYDLNLLNHHETVNDQVGDIPFAVVWCPLANAAAVYGRRYGGRDLAFEPDGGLLNASLVVRDRETDSLWSILTGDAIGGELEGTRLDQWPVGEKVQWRDWKLRHPETLVLSVDGREHIRNNPYDMYLASSASFRGIETADDRLGNREPIYAFQVGNARYAVPFAALEGGAVVRVGERELFLYRPRGGERPPVHAGLRGRRRRVRQEREGLVHAPTGASFDPERGGLHGGPRPRWRPPASLRGPRHLLVHVEPDPPRRPEVLEPVSRVTAPRGPHIITLWLCFSAPPLPRAPPRPPGPVGGVSRGGLRGPRPAGGRGPWTGRLEEAIELYGRARELRPAWDEGQWYLGTLFYEAGRHAECVEAFSRFLELKPRAGPGGRSGGCTRSRRRPRRGRGAPPEGIDLGLGGTKEETRDRLALALLKTGRFELAVEGYTHLARTSPESPGLLDEIGLLLLRSRFCPPRSPRTGASWCGRWAAPATSTWRCAGRRRTAPTPRWWRPTPRSRGCTTPTGSFSSAATARRRSASCGASSRCSPTT